MTFRYPSVVNGREWKGIGREPRVPPSKVQNFDPLELTKQIAAKTTTTTIDDVQVMMDKTKIALVGGPAKNNIDETENEIIVDKKRVPTTGA